MESEAMRVLGAYGPLGGVVAIVLFFLQYLKTRDQAQQVRDAAHRDITSRALDTIDANRTAMTEMVTEMRSCRARRE